MEGRETTIAPTEETVDRPDRPVSSDGSEYEYNTMELQNQTAESPVTEDSQVYTTQTLEGIPETATNTPAPSATLLFTVGFFGLAALMVIAVLLTKKLKK